MTSGKANHWDRAKGRFQQDLGHMLDHLRAFVFHQAPEQIVGRQLAVARIEATDRQDALALKRQGAADVGITAHQVEVEIRLERRLRGLAFTQATFVAVHTARSRVVDDTVGQHQQRRLNQTIARTQQIEPVTAVELA